MWNEYYAINTHSGSKFCKIQLRLNDRAISISSENDLNCRRLIEILPQIWAGYLIFIERHWVAMGMADLAKWLLLNPVYR